MAVHWIGSGRFGAAAGGGNITIGSSIEAQYASGTSPTTGALSITSGSAVIVAALCNTGAPTSVTDSAGNTYTLIDTQQQSSFNDRYLSCYYAQNVTGGASVTWTVNYTGSRVVSVAVQELDGTATSSYQSTTKAKSNTDEANPRTIDTAAAVTTNWMVVHVGAAHYSLTQGFTANSPFTLRIGQTAAAGAGQVYIGTYLATSTAVVTGSFSQTGTDCEQMIWAMS